MYVSVSLTTNKGATEAQEEGVGMRQSFFAGRAALVNADSFSPRASPLVSSVEEPVLCKVASP